MEEAELQTQRICAVLACCTNLLMTQLILHYSPKHIGVYKYFMIYISVFEILYAILDVLIAPRIFLKDCTFLIIVDANKTLLPRSWAYMANVLYCDFFGTSMAIFAIHFVYRYLVVSGNKLLSTFHSYGTTIWLLFPFVFGSIWTVAVYATLQPTPLKDQFLQEQFPERRANVSDFVYLGPYFYPKDKTGNSNVDWNSFVGIATITTMLSLSVLTMTYFGVKCYWKMKSIVARTSGSSHFRTLQSQLFYALVLQTAIPFSLMHLPCSYIFISAFLSKGNETLGHLLTYTIALYPVLDPLPNMFIIKSYRKALLRCGRKKEKKDVPVSTQIPMSTLDVSVARSDLNSARSSFRSNSQRSPVPS